MYIKSSVKCSSIDRIKQNKTNNHNKTHVDRPLTAIRSYPIHEMARIEWNNAALWLTNIKQISKSNRRQPNQPHNRTVHHFACMGQCKFRASTLSFCCADCVITLLLLLLLVVVRIILIAFIIQVLDFVYKLLFKYTDQWLIIRYEM